MPRISNQDGYQVKCILSPLCALSISHHFGHYFPMENRLRKLRKGRGLTLEGLGKLVGTSKQQIMKLEKSQRRLTDDWIRRLSTGLNCSMADLLDETEVPVLGYVGAGGEVIFVDDHEKGAAHEFVEGVPGLPGSVVAVRVRGDSMRPVYKDRTIIYYSRHEMGWDSAECLNEDCVVKIADDGIYIKTLKQGTQPGLYTLRSFNPAYPDMEDVQVEWAAVVEATRRGK